jgi:hypothetical protein
MLQKEPGELGQIQKMDGLTRLEMGCLPAPFAVRAAPHADEKSAE